MVPICEVSRSIDVELDSGNPKVESCRVVRKIHTKGELL